MTERPMFAGERMRMAVDAEGTATFTFDDVGTGRVCGSCQLCCKLVPVPPLAKPAGTRCRHQKAGKGCGIYVDRPFACRSWGCRWLIDPEAAALPRPDRAHFVVDMEEDYVRLQPQDGGEARKVPVIQIWVDPAFPEAHRQPALRAYMLMMAERHRVATILRWSSREALTVFPPPLTNGAGWQEMGGTIEARTPEERKILLDFAED